MESQRSRKSRSIAIDPKASRQSKTPRPELGERVKSSPAVAPTRQNDSRSARSSVAGDRNSNARNSGFSVQSSARSDSKPGSLAPSRNVSTQDMCPQINFAVLGASEVGKSTFIQKALVLNKVPGASTSAKKMSLDGVIYQVGLTEVDIDEIDYSNGREVVWPKDETGAHLPSFNGVFCLYDVTQQDSIAEIPGVLLTLSKSAAPCMLVACKCDQAQDVRQVNPRFNSKISTSFPGVASTFVSVDLPGSQQQCILKMLRAVLVKSAESSRQSSPGAYRARAATAIGASSSFGDPLSKPRSHSRSKSELPRSTSRGPSAIRRAADADSESDSSSAEDQHEEVVEQESKSALAKKQLRLNTNAKLYTTRSDPQTPPSTSGLYLSAFSSPSERNGSDIPNTPDSFQVTSVLRPGTATTAGSQGHRTFLDMGDESQEEHDHTDEPTESLEISKLKLGAAKQERGRTFDELTNNLLSLPTTKQESKFVPTFLCLYRAFATPSQLLSAIIAQFESVETSGKVELARVAEQLRYLQVLAQWTAEYPGDFYTISIRETIMSFIRRLSSNKNFTYAAKEIGNHFEVHAVDDDSDWAFTEATEQGRGRQDTHTTQSSGTTASNSTAISSTDELVKSSTLTSANISDGEDGEEGVGGKSHSSAPSISSSGLRTPLTLSHSSSNLLNLDKARHDAERLKRIPRMRLTKVQWHFFLETPSEEFAREATRVDWTTYSAIRPRDFVRHAIMTGTRKYQFRYSDNISAMVKHFNHLALFVSGMILLRDKPKHRAKALEKFMDIAWKVRQLNNYNSLGAIVAGINGHEIHRLSLTNELVPPKVQKDFLRLTVLMGIAKGHATYRMAWENSSSERIPFIPLIRQDLTLAANGNRTFVGPAGDKINWKKFELMGDVIMTVQASQNKPYVFPQPNEEITKLILESKILEGPEDCADPRSELHDRSVQLEPPGVGGDASRKKFDWFRR